MIKFKEVPIGAEFFDPASGEDFVKISDTHGKEVRNGEKDEFGPDEEVDLNQRA